MKKKYYVYKITNMINNKFYIGKRETTTEAETDTTYMGSGLLIRMSIKKYGIENFTKEIIHNCENREELNIQEKYWIKKLNSMDRNICFFCMWTYICNLLFYSNFFFIWIISECISTFSTRQYVIIKNI